MKKFLTFVLASVLGLCLTGCDTADIQVGVYEDGTAYFNDSTIVPTMILQGEEEKEIEDKYFFGYLMNAIQDRPVVTELCNCEALYTVAIKEYRFALHSDGIVVTQYVGGSCEYWKHMIYVGEVACDAETMGELFAVLENVK